MFFSDWDQISFHFSAPPPAPHPNCVFLSAFSSSVSSVHGGRGLLCLFRHKESGRGPRSLSLHTSLSLSHFPLTLTQSVRALLIAIHFSLAFTLAIRLSLPIHPSISLDKTCFLLSHFPSQNRGFKGKEGEKSFK